MPIISQIQFKHNISILNLIELMTNFLIYLLFTLTPLLVSPFSSELFELPKTYFLYLITGLLLLSHLKGYLQKKHPIFIFSFDKYSSFYGYYGRFNGGILTLLCYLIIFFILHIHFSLQPKLPSRLLTCLLVSSQLVVVYALAQHFGIDKHYWDQDVQARVFSTFGQPNWLAAYLCVIFFLALHKSDSDLRQNDKSNKHVILNLFQDLSKPFLLCSSLLALFFTKSQSGFYAFIISFSLYLLAKIITKTFSKHLFFLSCFFLLLCVILENPLKNKLFPAPVLPIPNPTGEEIVITASSDIRKIVWPGAIALGLKFPLFGTGPETFAQTYYWVRPASHNLTSEWNFLYNKAHNEFLNYLANTGFFGLLSYLLLILFTSLLLLKNHSFELLAGFLTILITNFPPYPLLLFPPLHLLHPLSFRYLLYPPKLPLCPQIFHKKSLFSNLFCSTTKPASLQGKKQRSIDSIRCIGQACSKNFPLRD